MAWTSSSQPWFFCTKPFTPTFSASRVKGRRSCAARARAAFPKTPRFFPGSSGTTWLSPPALASTDNSPLKFWALASAHSRGPGHRVLSPHRSTSVEATPRKALLWRPRNTGRPTGYTLLRRRHSSKGAELQVVVAERLLFAREGGAFPAYAHRES